MAGGELRLGTTSMYMTTYITRFGTSLHINTNLHGYILSDKCKLIAQNQAFERVNRGKFSLEGLAVSRGDRMTSWPYSQSCRTASIRSGRAGGLAGELERPRWSNELPIDRVRGRLGIIAKSRHWVMPLTDAW